MPKSESEYRYALEGKRLPPLVLDQEWHRLFTQMGVADARISSCSERMLDLIKRQGKLVNESKDLKKIKQRLMDEIVELASDESAFTQKKTMKKLENNRRLVQECNQKFDDYQQELMDIPREIESINRDLMVRSMELCYDKLKESSDTVTEINKWIEEIKKQIKENVVKKQRLERYIRELYTYMHNIFGASVVELFDMKFPFQSTGESGKGEFTTQEKRSINS